MGKIVKYCAACDESFAEKFGFCPNCGQSMTAFEMNPLVSAAPVSEAVKPDAGVDQPIFRTSEPTYKVPENKVPENKVSPSAVVAPISANQTSALSGGVMTKDAEDVPVEEIAAAPSAPKTFAAAAGANGNGNFNQAAGDGFPVSNIIANRPKEDFNVTVIEEKNGKQRNLLLLGSLALMLTLALGGTVYSLFNKDFGVGAIDDGSLFASIVVDEVPVEIEEQPKPKDKDDGGGGGGGGKEEPEPASKGRLVSQSEKPITPPDAKLPQLTNPDIKIFQETQGKIKRPITEERAGLPNSGNLNPSNGTGRGGGIGGGNGTGIGGGNGTGEGNGNGSGSGNGDGNGNGNGRGDGSGTKPPPPPPVKPVPAGPTEAIKIFSKPQPKYTDAARTNNVTGTVTLRVTFTANGQIGSIAPVSGLPYGLTEQAISAARLIKFEPPKRNGVPYAVSKTIAYTFSIF
ncbi:MAG: energy transducer TonB [Pyrinomonadaceae bacterium]|nr:energy transducer TonB [Pyrinomonadaceae bacterium]